MASVFRKGMLRLKTLTLISSRVRTYILSEILCSGLPQTIQVMLEVLGSYVFSYHPITYACQNSYTCLRNENHYVSFIAFLMGELSA